MARTHKHLKQFQFKSKGKGAPPAKPQYKGTPPAKNPALGKLAAVAISKEERSEPKKMFRREEMGEGHRLSKKR